MRVLAPILAASVALPAAAQTSAPVQELQVLEQALEGAVRRVSRASLAHQGPAERCRSYPLRGYGVVFVLPPRAIPARPRPRVLEPSDELLERAIRSLRESLKTVQQPELRAHVERRIEALERVLAARRLPGLPEETLLRAAEAQARVFELQAAAARAAAERAIAEVSREVQKGLVPPEPPPPSAPEAVLAPRSPAESGPPWRSWLDTEEDGARPPDAVIRDVGAAVTEVLEAHGASLRSLKPEEFVVVAVDFFPRGGFLPRERPERTLVVRVRKKELDERHAGRLPSEEFRGKVELVEY
ncbi:MAG: hypothetical protein HY317_04220 [Acidobacteria bacterium]|nr:hypothetical protein [Acidobacteriota bacterium]